MLGYTENKYINNLLRLFAHQNSRTIGDPVLGKRPKNNSGGIYRPWHNSVTRLLPVSPRSTLQISPKNSCITFCLILLTNEQKCARLLSKEYLI